MTWILKGAWAARSKNIPSTGREHMGDEEFSELIGLIYDAALGPDAWRVVLNRLADALSARCGVIGSRNSSTNATVMTAPRTDPDIYVALSNIGQVVLLSGRARRTCRSARSWFGK